MTFGRMTLGANGVANNLFPTILFSDPDVRVVFLKSGGQIRSSMVCCKCGSQLSWCGVLIVRTVTDDDVRGSHCFRMLRFHVNQARFMVSAENLLRVLFLTYVVVRSYEHDREHVVACEGIPQSLQPHEGLHLSPGPLHVCGGVPIRQLGPFHQVHRHRCNHRLSVATVDWSHGLEWHSSYPTSR
jgi:hypothetical protein